MFRINGRPIKNNRNLLHGLSDVFGVSLSKAGQIIGELGLSPNMKVKRLTAVQQKQITDKLKQKDITPSIIKKDRRDSIERLKTIYSYRGLRHKFKYPVRGQRNKSNGKTQKRIGHTHTHL